MRISTPLLLAVLATWLGAATVPARAGTTLSTSVSDSVSAAVGSVSTSLKKLSQSVSGDDKVAQGPYRVIEVAAAPDQPEHLRLTLQATADNPAPEGLYALTVPRKAVQAHDVHVGQVLVAEQRAYGLVFAKVEAAVGATVAGLAPREAFFLVLDDAWYRELAVQPVRL